MARLLTRKVLLILVLLPLLNFVGFFYATTLGPSRLDNRSRQQADAPTSYSAYLGRVLSGDWGRVETTPIPTYVASLLDRSARLLLIAIGLTLLLGPLLGIASISPQTGRMTPRAQTILIIGSSLPGFFLGSLLIGGLIWLSRVGWYTGPGTLIPVQGYGFDRHLIIPVLTLAARPVFYIAYLTAGMIEHEFQQDYIRVARSKGLGWRGLLWRHALPNVAPSLIISLGQAARLLIGGLILVEALFDWRGFGWAFLRTLRLSNDSRAFAALQPDLLAFLLLIFGALLLLADLIASLSAHAIDPQSRVTAPELA